MKLSDLPPELLQQILNGAFRSYLVLELWKTGDRKLMSALVNKGVTDIDLRDTVCNTSRWPSCLKEFQVDRLSFELSYRNVIPTQYLRKELKQLHGGLKQLRIVAQNALEAILPPPESPGLLTTDDEVPLPPKRAKTRNADNDTTHQTLWDLSHTWPSLEHLELEIGYEICQTPYNARMLTLLPRSLTYLGLGTSQLHPVLDLMPPNLQTLRLLRHSLSPHDLYQLPKSITNLDFSVSKDALLLLNRERDLLPQLTPFPGYDYRGTMPSCFTDPILDGTLTWPDNITKLTCRMPDSADYEHLPQSLTSFSSEPNGPMLLSRSIGTLPRGLASLSISSIEWSDFDVSTWPSTLTSLYLFSSSGFDVDYFHKLPRRLCMLTASKDEENLVLSRFDIDTLCNIGIISLATDSLWPSIKHEILTCRSTSVPLEALESYVKSIESGRLYGLPLTLTSLQLPHLLLATTAKLLLPPRVTSITHRPALVSRFWTVLLESLPPTTSAFFHIHMHYLERTLESPATILRPLSETLFASRLSTLILSADFPLSENLFMSLPRTLTSLNVSHLAPDRRAVNPEHLQHLPSNLKQLDLSLLFFTDLLAPWVHYLPRTLERIATPSMTIIGRHIKDLPPTLTLLNCSFFEVSLPQVLDFPTTLTSLHVTHSGGNEMTPLRHCLIDKAWETLSEVFRPFWRVREAGIHGMMIELSIASKKWRLKPQAHHTGSVQFAKIVGHPAPKRTKTEPNDNNIDYTSTDVTKYTKKTKDKSVLVDPRTSRRVSGYK